MQALSNYLQRLKQTQSFDVVVGFTRMVGLDIYFAADNSFVATRYKGLKRFLPRYNAYAQIEKSLFSNTELKAMFLTESQKQSYLQQYKLQANNTMVLPVCIDVEFQFDEATFRQARIWRKQQTRTEDKTVLLFVAADFKTKGLDRVIDALASLSSAEQKQFVLWVVGDGKQAPYQKMLKRLPDIQVQFFGGQSEVTQYYLAADYLIHPARKEAAGMVIAEALAAKLPIVVTDICGYAYLAEEDKQSIIIDYHQVKTALVSALTRILEQSPIERGEGSEQILFRSRAEVCAEQIEKWCGVTQ
jgi:UDP-glucose:(heptosyl)LPS alpha-1,3-glucosyltransferase